MIMKTRLVLKLVLLSAAGATEPGRMWVLCMLEEAPVAFERAILDVEGDEEALDGGLETRDDDDDELEDGE